MGYLGGYQDKENLTQTGNEREFESSLDGYDVHFEEGLDLFGIGVREIDFWCPKALYYALQREYSILHPIKVTEYQTPNLWRMSNLYSGTDDVIKENDWLDLFAEKRTLSQNTYIYAYTYNTFASNSSNMITQFSIPTTAEKDSYDWSRNQKHGTATSSENINGLGFFWKGSTTYTLRFKLRCDRNQVGQGFRVQIGQSGNQNIDTTKPIYINGREMGYWYPDSGIGTNTTRRVYCQVSLEDIIGQDVIDKRSPLWHVFEIQFTTLPQAELDAKTYHTVRLNLKRGTQISMLEPMLYKGENTLNPEFTMTPQEVFEYEYDRGLQGLTFIQPALGFYYSKEYDFACAYKVNQLKGLQVLDYNESTGMFKIRAEIDVFKQINNVEVKYYEKNADAVADTSMNIYNTIAHSNVIDDSGGNPSNSSYFLKTSGKGGIVTSFHVNPNNNLVPYTFIGSVQTDTWDLAGYTNVWGNMMYYYTGDAMENKVEN